MKNSLILPSTISILTLSVLFLINVQTSLAQTTNSKPAISDVANTKSVQVQNTNNLTPDKTTIKRETGVQNVKTQDIQTTKVNDKAQVTENVYMEPKSFIDKARNVIQDRLQNTNATTSAIKNVTEKQQEDASARVYGFINNIDRKMNAAILRLEKLGLRIESRIKKMEEEGLDMTEANELLMTSKESISNSMESISTLLKNSQEGLENGISKDTFNTVVSEITKAKYGLKDVQEYFVKIVQIMKDSIPNEKGVVNEQN
jgi:hypothetical protein